MEKQKNIPLLRFPGFEGEWEKRRLGELSTINPSTTNLPDQFIYVDLESVTNGDLTKEVIVNKNEAPSRAQRVLDRNDILFQMVRPYQKNNLFFEKTGHYVASTGYAQIKIKQNSRFFYQYLHLQKFVDDVIEKCTGTSYPAINSKDLAKISISFPTPTEQQKIATFFTAIDQKIAQLKKKHNLLEQYKKGVMQKIFSQQIRFKDDNGQEFPKWVKKKLGEVFQEHKEKSTINNQHNVFTSSNKGLLLQKDYYGENRITERENKGFNIIPEGYLTYRSRSDNGIFTFNINNLGQTGILSTYYPVFYAINGINKFFAEYLNLNWKLISVFSVGTSQKVFPFSAFKKIKLPLPSLSEQSKIAQFLTAIDEKIQHTQKQIAQAEQWKKGLMQKMFV